MHDRLALYWKLKKARHGLCAAHLLRELAPVAEATQSAWADGLAGLLVEINVACDAARAAGLKALAPPRQYAFRSRYDDLVANPEPASGRKRTSLQRHLATAFDNDRQAILRYMYDLEVSLTNNQAEPDHRPVKITARSPPASAVRPVSSASPRPQLPLTTRKNDIGALDARTRPQRRSEQVESRG